MPDQKPAEQHRAEKKDAKDDKPGDRLLAGGLDPNDVPQPEVPEDEDA
jgi:hypothetical protein